MVGDVVLAPFPFTDLSDVKIRPALVVADVGQDDWILCQITSGSQERPRVIEISSADFQWGGLRRRSWARPDRLATLHEGAFIRVIGHLSDSKQSEIADSIRDLF